MGACRGEVKVRFVHRATKDARRIDSRSVYGFVCQRCGLPLLLHVKKKESVLLHVVARTSWRGVIHLYLRRRGHKGCRHPVINGP